MHRDKTVARIILILSVVHGAVAAPAIVRQRSLNVDDDVTAASEKRGGDAPQGLFPVPQMDNEPPTTLGVPPSQDPSLKSGTPQLHNEPPTTLGVPPSQDPSPESGTPQLHNDPTPTSGAPPLHDDTSSAPGDPPSHNDRPLTSEILPAHDDLLPGSGQDTHGPVWQWLKDAHPGEGASSWPHEGSEPVQWPDSERVAPVPPPPPPPPPPTPPPTPPSPSPPKANRILSDEMKRKLKIFAGFVVFAGVTAGVGYGVDQIINDSHGHAHGAQPAGRDITSSDIVGRGVSTHTRPLRKPVSLALANLRNEDLRLLNVLTRRALERLD